MCPRLFLGCSGWNYGDPYEKGGWLNVFYPDNKTRKLNYYSQFFDTVEVDATFYKRFYEHMTLGLFTGITKATSDDFKIPVKVPETITHEKRLDVSKDVMVDLKEFLEKISPLNNTNKLGAIIIQLPPSFTIKESKILEKFLDVLKNNSDIGSKNHYALEFRHNYRNIQIYGNFTHITFAFKMQFWRGQFTHHNSDAFSRSELIGKSYTESTI
jgi:uncharacterized protein YecE (DUF72 family)